MTLWMSAHYVNLSSTFSVGSITVVTAVQSYARGAASILSMLQDMVMSVCVFATNAIEIKSASKGLNRRSGASFLAISTKKRTTILRVEEEAISEEIGFIE